jgi:hypothetical protein
MGYLKNLQENPPKPSRNHPTFFKKPPHFLEGNISQNTALIDSHSLSFPLITLPTCGIFAS